jgi:tetratricopeptide (TPR) repeat protein
MIECAFPRVTWPRGVVANLGLVRELWVALGTIHLAIGHPHTSADYHQQALHLAHQTNARYTITETRLGLAAGLRDLHQHAEATAHAIQALDHARHGEYRTLEGHAHTTLATIHHATGDDQKAADHADTALTIHRHTGHRIGQAHALTAQGHALHHASEDAAHTCWQQAQQILTESGADTTTLDLLLRQPATQPAASADSPQPK